eukprot:gene13296-1593_t
MGRGPNYVGEEDWAATSTGVLGTVNISRKAIGLDDVVLQLDDGRYLRVSTIDSPDPAAHTPCLCTLHESQEKFEAFGPFKCIVRAKGRKEIHFFNGDDNFPLEDNRSAPVSEGKSAGAGTMDCNSLESRK